MTDIPWLIGIRVSAKEQKLKMVRGMLSVLVQSDRGMAEIPDSNIKGIEYERGK